MFYINLTSLIFTAIPSCKKLKKITYTSANMPGKIYSFFLFAIIVVCDISAGQRVSKWRKNQCDFEQPTCGLCGRLINVTLIARNELQEPTFELIANVVRFNKRELLSVLEEAAKTVEGFKFTTTYSDQAGYTITSINGLDSSQQSQTFWQISSNDLPLNCSIQHYVPRNEETIVLNFTTSA